MKNMILHLSRYFKGLKHFQQFWEKTIREMCLMNVSEKEFFLITYIWWEKRSKCAYGFVQCELGE